MKRIAITLLALVAARMAAPPCASAQWKKVMQLTGTRGASAFFFNANEGVIGTGEYNPNPGHGLPIRIYYTTNGGATWTQSYLPRQNLIGQVTDFFFTDHLHGWATIKERDPIGWSGVYRTTDGGRRWSYVIGADYPITIRETKRGVFYTDHGSGQLYPYFGIVFSSDEGANWKQIASCQYPLGLDFIDDANGMASSSGGGQQPHLITSDSGKTWTSIDVETEAWSLIGDPATRTFVLASERDQVGDFSSIVHLPASSTTESGLKSYGRNALTGGAAAWKSCTASTIYMQGYLPNGPQGLIRSKDGGINWQFVGGPVNVQDTRFAVTGRGAVVYAFDSTGGVWKTGFGGDTTLSPSALKYVTIQKTLGNISASLCDSAYATFLFGYRACDSNRIVRVTFLNDSLGELSAPKYSNDFRFYSQSRSDSLNILFHPSKARTWQAQVRITLAQPDGYEEDTTVTIDLNGLPARASIVTFLDTTAPKLIDFGNTSTCTGAERPVILSNDGCGDLVIDQLISSDPAFSVVSTFRPFTLNSGSKRTFLIRYSPTTSSPNSAILIAHHNGASDSIALKGTGFTPSLALEITKPDTVTSALCDTALFNVTLRNVACKAFKVAALMVDTPFVAPAIMQLDSIHSGESRSIGIRFGPNAQAPVTRTVTLKVFYDGGQEYDTTVSITGVGTSGFPQLAVNGIAGDSIYRFDMGSISFCSDALDTVLFLSKGCGFTTINSATFGNAGVFSLDHFNIAAVPSDKADTMIVRYHPKQIGADSAVITLQTTSGTKTLKFYSNVTSDPGSIQITSTQGLSTTTCDSAAFSIGVTNGTCDSVTIVAAKITGANPNDFFLRSSLPIGLGTRAQKNITGIFQPQDSLARTATAVLTIKRSDGKTFDTTVPLSAVGIGVPTIPIDIGFDNTTSTQFPFGLVIIPVYARVASPLPLGALDITLDMRTDLLTPIAPETFGPDIGPFSFSIPSITIKPDKAIIHLERSTDTMFKAGELCAIVCTPFVTDTLATTIILESATLSSLSNSNSCLQTKPLHDSVFTFNLISSCNSNALSDYIKTRTLLISRIAPNPTSGEVTVTLDVPSGYKSDGSLEAYDALGERLLTMPLTFTNAGKQNVALDLSSKASGVCYIVLKSASGVSTSRVMIEK